MRENLNFGSEEHPSITTMDGVEGWMHDKQKDGERPESGNVPAGTDDALEAVGKDVPSDVSVLIRLEEGGVNAPRVVLRDTKAEETSIVRPGTREAPGGRYQTAGEVARGGVGVILKCRDVDLGRDVAMKVLLRDHAGNEQLMERFVEEAQIGGQLQHPGIVPVYELGLNEEQRPYFTMKFVKGETLAALLADREDPSRDLGKFLGIFQQMCMTVAYAHSRGVIHRDLKPANVIIGAFGEVMVVDWGFAKVMARGGVADERRSRTRHEPSKTVVRTLRSGSEPGSGSDSVAGSVMGTPQYMPPEQALGDVDAMDARSDVFGLGAILCEILTGQPPYPPGELSPIVQAAQARLDGAHARLEACDADDDVIDLCRRCLDPVPSKRPRNADSVARAIADHLQHVEERAREARVAADAAGKARKWAVAVAAALLLGLGVSIFAWREAGAQRSRAQEARDLAEANARDARTISGLTQRAYGRQQMLWGTGAKARVHLSHALEKLPRDKITRMLIARLRLRLPLRTLQGKWPRGASATWTSDGSRILVRKSREGPRIFDARTGETLPMLRAQERDDGTSSLLDPGGRRLLSVDRDGKAQIFDVTDAGLNPVATLEEDLTSMGLTKFSPDGRKIVTVGSGQSPRIFDSGTGKLVATLEKRGGRVREVILNRDGSRVATRDHAGTMRVFDAQSGAWKVDLDHPSGEYSDWAARSLREFSPDGRRVLTLSRSTWAAWIFDTETGKREAVLSGHWHRLVHATFNLDGTRVATTSHDNTARLYDVSDLSEVKTVLRFEGHSSSVLYASFSTDGSRLVTTSHDGTARIFGTGRHSIMQGKGTTLAVFEGHEDTVWGARFSPDGNRVVTWSEDGTACIFDPARSTKRPHLDGPGWVMATSRDVTRVVTVAREKKTGAGTLVRVLDTTTGRKLATLTGHTKNLQSAEFSRDGTRAVTTSEDATARIYDVDADTSPTVINLTRMPQGWRYSAAFSANGERVVVCDRRGARIFDARTAELLETLDHRYGVRFAAFGPNDRRLVTVDHAGDARVFDLSASVEPAVLSWPSTDVTGAVFSGDGRHILTYDGNAQARVYESRTGTVRSSLDLADGMISSGAFSPDGTLLVTTSLGGPPRVLDARNGETLLVLGQRGAGGVAAFSPDGTHVYTLDRDETGAFIRMWNIEPDPRPDEEIKEAIHAQAKWILTEEGVLLPRS